jgi:hypothetical protein
MHRDRQPILTDAGRVFVAYVLLLLGTLIAIVALT